MLMCSAKYLAPGNLSNLSFLAGAEHLHWLLLNWAVISGKKIGMEDYNPKELYEVLCYFMVNLEDRMERIHGFA